MAAIKAQKGKGSGYSQKSHNRRRGSERTSRIHDKRLAISRRRAFGR